MNPKRIVTLLRKYRSGRISSDAVLRELRHLPFQDLGFAKVDHHRALRCGSPEVVFGQGKTIAQVRGICRKIIAAGHDLLVTRATPAVFRTVRGLDRRAKWHEVARCVTVRRGAAGKSKIENRKSNSRIGNSKFGIHNSKLPPGILIVTAGTADLPVAEEARVTAEALGRRAELIVDVGVAGIHRLLRHAPRLQAANVLVVVAGMEGALAGVVGGLVDRPVIAVPTSVGYGASFRGVAPLLTMLNSCAAGVSVVNIDNGFGAGYLAAMIDRNTDSTD